MALTTQGPRRWTNKSVRQFVPEGDPISKIIEKARRIVLEAKDAGWMGPPYDPIDLAKILKMDVIPREDVTDARILVTGGSKFVVEYNPRRPAGRVKFSIAHEIAHTFFPDCHERIRHRQSREEMDGDDWQLELLCNLGAAELLMPFADLASDAGYRTIDDILALRNNFGVSTEAILLRIVKISDNPIAIFAASQVESGRNHGQYKLDYFIGSQQWTGGKPSSTHLPSGTIASECTAIGFTAKGRESWNGIPDPVTVEAVGLPPYPGNAYPRVVGIVKSSLRKSSPLLGIEYLKGDALNPRKRLKHQIIAHVVNDKTPRWGGGFAREVKKRYPSVQDDFIVSYDPSTLRKSLGKYHMLDVSPSRSVFSMISQHGYEPTAKPSIRYAALEKCLRKLSEVAIEKNASVHMPRIGCGQAGGDWNVVSELLDDSLCKFGVPVYVYDLANENVKKSVESKHLFAD